MDTEVRIFMFSYSKKSTFYCMYFL